MGVRMRRAAQVAIAFGLSAGAAAPSLARAETFFVDKAGGGLECTEAAPCATIGQALVASRAAAGTGDEIRVGPGLYAEQVSLNDANDAGLTLKGAGPGPDQAETPPGATTIRAPETNKGGAVLVTGGSGITVEDLRVEVPAGFINGAAVSLGAPRATLRNDQLQSAGDANTEAVYVLPGGAEASVLESRIRQTGTYRGVAIFGPQATVADSDVYAKDGQALDTENTPGTRVLRSRLATESGTVVTIRSPEAVIDSSLIVGGSEGLEAYAGFAASNAATLSNDTIDIGAPKQADSAIDVRSRAEGGATAAVTLVNSIALDGLEVAGTATAAISCFTSELEPKVETPAAGTISCGAEKGNSAGSPAALFVPGDDWHLRPGSPAVDSGAGRDALSATDLDGAPRVADGNGDGTAAIDRGAYELQPPAPIAAPPSNAFMIGKLKRNRRRGTATLQVKVPGPGGLVLEGKRVRRFSRVAAAAGVYSLKIAPGGKLARRLRSVGSARALVDVVFTPSGGTANMQSKKIRLIRRGRGSRS